MNELAALAMGGAVLTFAFQQPYPASATSGVQKAPQRELKVQPKLSTKTLSLQLASAD